MVDLLLIKPPYYDEGGELDLTTSLEMMPPLGLGYVAAACKNFSTAIIDIEAKRIKSKEIGDYIKKYNPKVVGITVMSSTVEQAKIIANEVKKISNIKIIIGGPHAVLDPESLIDIGDYIVCGEAEIMINSLLDYIIKNKGNINNIKNVAFRKGNKIIYTKKELIKDLNLLEFPKRELWDKNNYFHFFAKNKPCTSIITSRGCPYQCIYCTPIYRTLRRRSVNNVIEEIKEIILKFGIHDMEFFDETFNLPENWVIEFCNKIKEEGIKISWRARCRPDLISEESVKKMKEAGCYMISMGVESANDKTLKFFNKNYTLEQIKKAIKIIKSNKIELHGYFIIGSPTESRAETYNTVNFAISQPFDYAIFSILTPQPNTPLMKIAQDNKWMLDNKVDYKKIKGYCQPTMIHPEMSQDEILKIYKNATIRFFLKPGRMFAIAKRILFGRGIERKRVIKTMLNYILSKK